MNNFSNGLFTYLWITVIFKDHCLFLRKIAQNNLPYYVLTSGEVVFDLFLLRKSFYHLHNIIFSALGACQ